VAGSWYAERSGHRTSEVRENSAVQITRINHVLQRHRACFRRPRDWPGARLLTFALPPVLKA